MGLREFIRKTICENILNEGHREVHEIDNLTTEIIQFLAEENFPLVNRIAKRNEKNYFFYTDIFDISEVKPKNQYKFLETLLKYDLTFSFQENIRNSFFNPISQNRFIIYIKHPTQDFIHTLNYNIDAAKERRDPDDNSFSEEDCVRILKTSLGVAYRNDIIHELQHAFDFFKSDGKYTNDKLSKSYYQKYKPDHYDLNYEKTPEEYLAYLNLPHEYWARLSEYVNSTTKLNRDFDTLFDDFKKSNIIRFNQINSPKDKAKLIKALYKVWDSNREKKKQMTLSEEASNRFVFLPYDDEYSEEFEDYGIDQYEAADMASQVAKNGGLNILRDKRLSGILLDTQAPKVIGGLWVSDSSDKFSFDIALESSYQNMGLSNILIKNAIDEYRIQKDMYEESGQEFEMEVDVINPKLAQILKSKYGFHVVAELSPTRVLMGLG